MDIHSGEMVKTVRMVTRPDGVVFEPGTEAMVLGVSSSVPRSYLVETLESTDFEQEAFFCRADDFLVVTVERSPIPPLYRNSAKMRLS